MGEIFDFPSTITTTCHLKHIYFPYCNSHNMSFYPTLKQSWSKSGGHFSEASRSVRYCQDWRLQNRDHVEKMLCFPHGKPQNDAEPIGFTALVLCNVYIYIYVDVVRFNFFYHLSVFGGCSWYNNDMPCLRVRCSAQSSLQVTEFCLGQLKRLRFTQWLISRGLV